MIVEEIDQEKLEKTLVFIGKLLVAGLFFRAFLYFSPSTSGLQSFLAQTINYFLSILGITVERNGYMLVDQTTTYIVTQDCLGWKSMAAFTALVFASTEKMLKHSRILISGLGAIIAFNFLRVLTTIILSHYGVVSFDIIHTLFWKWGMTLIVFLLWSSWLLGKRDEYGEPLYTKARKVSV